MADVNFRLGPINVTPISFRSLSVRRSNFSIVSICCAAKRLEYFSTSASFKKSVTDNAGIAGVDSTSAVSFVNTLCCKSRSSMVAGPHSTLGTDRDRAAAEGAQDLDNFAK